MRFEIDEKQMEKLKVWQEAIKTIYGEYGNYDFTFKPTGIGDGVYVYSHLAKTTIDLTDVDSW
jgi:hypothetical protein